MAELFSRGFPVLLVLLTACVAAPPPGPSFGSVANALPPVPPGMARVFFYRWYEPYETLDWTTAFLNGAPVAAVPPGAVVYRDVSPGIYQVAVRTDVAYPNQFKSVTLSAGQILYVRVESLESWGCGGRLWPKCDLDTFAVDFIDPQQALAEMQNLPLVNG